MSQAFVRLMRKTTYEEISLDFEQPAGMLERICLVSLARIGISFDRVLFALVDFVLVVLGGNIRSKYFCWMYAEKKCTELYVQYAQYCTELKDALVNAFGLLC